MSACKRLIESSRPHFGKKKDGTCICSSCICDCPTGTETKAWGQFWSEDDGQEILVAVQTSGLPLLFYVLLCPCFFIHFLILFCIPLDKAAVFYTNSGGKPCFELRMKNCCVGWSEDYREDVVSVEVVVKNRLFYESVHLLVKTADGWPPYELKTSSLENKVDARAFADACNKWIERVSSSGNVNVPIAEVVVQQPYSSEAIVSAPVKRLGNESSSPLPAKSSGAPAPPTYAEATRDRTYA